MAALNERSDPAAEDRVGQLRVGGHDGCSDDRALSVMRQRARRARPPQHLWPPKVGSQIPQQREREFYVGTIDTYRYCTIVELLYLRLQLGKRLACRPCDHHRDPVALGTVGGPAALSQSSAIPSK